MKKVGIIGFGRFGELLAGLMKKKFDVAILETNEIRSQQAADQGFEIVDEERLNEVDLIVLAVPISAIKETIEHVRQFVQDGQVVMDICSVKVYPANLMKEYLGKCQLVATHPMFGPDSISKGLLGLQVAICPITINEINLATIVEFWEALGVNVIKATPEEHDRNSVYSQAFAYSVAKIILGIKLDQVNLTTRSFDALREVAALSANDSEQLFHDMLYYNPYYQEMKQELVGSIDITLDRLDEIEKEQIETEIF